MKPYLLIALMVLAISCSEEQGRQPSATGRSGEMLVVMNKAHWENKPGEIIKNTFTAQIPMFTQPEPFFNLVQIDHQSFTKLFESHRNIFIVDIDPSLAKAKIEASRDVWSFPQMVIRVYAPNAEVLEKVMEGNQQQFIEYYLKTERERMINAYSRMINNTARNTLRDRLGIDMKIPEGYFVAKEEDRFVWLRRTATREDLDMGVLITVLPYRDPKKDFDHKVIWARRDSITRAHVPGQFAGSYMTTYPDIPPLFREINFNERYAVEAQGLWRVEGDFMGGPFINYTMVDEKRNRLINVDAFVYYPNKNKRDYLRQLQALIYSIEFMERDTAELLQ